MNKRDRQRREPAERMSDLSFRCMTGLFRIADLLFPYIDRRIAGFGIHPGMTVVDYGCGPGRYTVALAGRVGTHGKVYAVDVHELAIAAVRRRTARLGLENVIPVLASGCGSGLPDRVADVVCAIDMFFGVRKPGEFLRELARIAKPEAILVIDDGHQTRKATKRKIEEAGSWQIYEESTDHLKCRQRRA